jgi:hypothetical protein
MSKRSLEQHFRMSKLAEGHIIYPFPPIKDKKWLITIDEGHDEAKRIVDLLNNDLIAGPLITPELYEQVGIHQDGKTPLFILKK